jgi:hypothetical protein
LVVKLKQTASGVHLNIFTDNSIWASNYETAAFGSKKQIVVNLSTAKYTNGDKKGKPLDTKNIRIVDFWGDRATIVVEDMYLTNNDDYSPQTYDGIDDIAIDRPSTATQDAGIYTLSGIRVSSGLHKGLYIKNGKIFIHQ